MSKYTERLPDGSVVTEISSYRECKHLYNEVCCCADSDFIGDYPMGEDCEICPFFAPEDGRE